TPNAKAAVKDVTALEAKSKDMLKCRRRKGSVTMPMPENMRPTVARDEQRKANVLATTNASKYHLPASVGEPPLGWSSAMFPPGSAKDAPKVTVAMSTEPMLRVWVEL
uniref:Uncharacterized protein n=1 Tax=Setaria italica TaxID=4555 RepID=K4AJ50_SETIT